ncbi:hypothetical protein ACQCN2_07510 [Brevibacillus ginsengisoli]|uniref:hypothetical protein n=1 Tax=Brevibacillus ginsengisoli TaxID=363854 RepID=UPI003CF18F92
MADTVDSMMKESSLQETSQSVHTQSELPIQGTALNPIETKWSMNDTATAMPADQLANAMQQGE